MVKLKIYQINIRGLISSSIKKDEFRNFILRGHFDIILVQEWNLNRYNINQFDNNTNKKKFPFQLRSDFNIHYQSTETAIIYNKRLNISRINFDFYTNWNNDNDRHKVPHASCVILHTKNSAIPILSIYNPPRSDPNLLFTQFFNFLPNDFNFIAGGDINKQHESWGGNPNQCDEDTITFYDNLIDKDINIINDGTPTHHNIHTEDTCIDISMVSNKLKINNINWKSTINEYGYSDHYNIIFNLYHTGNRDHSSTYEAWNFNTSIKNWNKYEDEFKILYNTWSPNSLSPTKAVSYLSDRILDYMHHYISTHSINENQSIYWSKKVEKCWRKKRIKKIKIINI